MVVFCLNHIIMLLILSVVTEIKVRMVDNSFILFEFVRMLFGFFLFGDNLELSQNDMKTNR